MGINFLDALDRPVDDTLAQRRNRAVVLAELKDRAFPSCEGYTFQAINLGLER